MFVLPTPIVLVLTEEARAQNAEVFVGLQLALRNGPGGQPDVGLGLVARATALPTPIGPELGVWADGRLFVRGGWEVGAGGTAGAGLGAFSDGVGYLPLVVNAKVGTTWSPRFGPAIRVGGEVRALFASLGFELYHLDGRRADEVPVWALPTVEVGLEMPLIPAYVVGRPLRAAGGWLLPPVLRGLTGEARRWHDQARGERASVGSFLRLARELAALGAPRSLVRRAERAAADEIRHAEDCLALASLHAGRRLALGPVPRPPARAPRRLVIAAEAQIDGVHGEGQAAEDAAIERDTTRDRRAAPVLATIAREEREHARLAADLVDWA